MSAKPLAAKPIVERPARWKAPARRVFFFTVFAGVVGFVGWTLWKQAEPSVLADPRYRLPIEGIEISPPPEWIHADIRAEALRDASLDPPLNLLDDDLSEKLRKAFAMHPWVERVEFAQRKATGISVALRYRQPVCMVEVKGGVFPVDAKGVLLPSQDFDEHDTGRYPRLGGIDKADWAPPGVRCRDPRVLAGARVAETLANVWDGLELRRIESTSSPGSRAEPKFDLVTRGGARVAWGHAPQAEVANEPSAEEKLATLADYARRHGSLDAEGGPGALDRRLGREAMLPKSHDRP